jgi:hypothetical protein
VGGLVVVGAVALLIRALARRRQGGEAES